MQTLTFFTTAGCHLCEQAKQTVAATGLEVRLREVDIACDDALVDAYGLRIPVLRNAAGQELDWPFSSADVGLLLKR